MDSFSNFQSIKNAMTPASQSSIYLCRINKVNINNFTADIYIIDIATTMQNIPICFPNRGNKYGSYFMPKEGSIHICLFTNKKKPFILLSGYITSNSDVGANVFDERLMGGENSITSVGGANIRQDLIGTTTMSSVFGNTRLCNHDGVNSDFSLGSENMNIANKNISGFNLRRNDIVTKNIFSGNEIKLINYSEYYSKIDLPKIYKPSEILIDNEIDQSIKNNILESTQNIIEKINGTDTIIGFKQRFYDYHAALNNNNLTDDEINNIINDFITGIKADFNILPKGVKIIIEKGNAINKELNNISEVSNLQSSEFDTSTQNNDICLRLKIKDIATGNIKAEASIDTEGNCLFKFKTLTVNVEAGGYSLVEG